MPGGDFFIMMMLLLLLLWTFVGRGVDGGNVTGVLHGRVELRGRYGNNTDVEIMEWAKNAVENSTVKLLYRVINRYNATCFPPCQNISFNLQTMSLILFNLTKKDEGIYEERVTLKNNTIQKFYITLSVQPASKIGVSSSPGSLTLKCDISDDFKLLQWFRNDRPLPDDQRFSLTENNKTMQVSNFTSSDYGKYTCLISNEYGTSAVYVNVSDDTCQQNTFPMQAEFTTILVGSSVICLVVLCIILICICRYCDRRKVKTASPEEPIYNEPTSFQEPPVTPTVDPLLVVYQDYIKLKHPISPKATPPSQMF